MSRSLLIVKVVDDILSRTSLKTMRKELNPAVGKIMQSTRTAEEAKKFPDEVEFVRKGQVRLLQHKLNSINLLQQ